MTPIALYPLLPYLATFVALFVRISAFFYTAPFVSDPAFPAKVRVAASASLAFGIAAAHDPIPLASLPLVVPIELLGGACAGFVARLAVAGLEAGGELIGLNMGLGFASMIDRVSGDVAQPIRTLAYALAGMAFMATGGPAAALRVLAAPIVGSVSPVPAMSAVVEHGGDVFVAAVRLAAPIMVSTLVAYVAFALASRAAPAMNVFSVAFAAVLVAGGITLLGTAPSFANELFGTIERIDDLMADVVAANPGGGP